MNKYIGGGIIVLIIAAAAGYWFMNRSTGQQVAVKPTLDTSNLTAQYTLADVAAHATPEDCWVAEEGVVYNVTPFIASGEHEGGTEAIISVCGTDATAAFTGEHTGRRANRAYTQLYEFAIGTLAAQ